MAVPQIKVRDSGKIELGLFNGDQETLFNPFNGRLNFTRGSGVVSNYLLDLYPGAAAAYSPFRLAASTVHSVRVRRDFDDAEADFSPEDLAAVASVPDAMVVDGGVTIPATLVYLRDGDFNNFPRYTIPTGTVGEDSIQFQVGFASYWEVTYGADQLGATDDYDLTDPPDTPDLVADWVLDPPITVRRATWADIDAAWIDRATVPLLTQSTPSNVVNYCIDGFTITGPIDGSAKTYARTPDVNDKDRFEYSEWSVSWTGTLWQIRDAEEILWTSTEDVDYPWQVQTWTMVNGSGTAPTFGTFTGDGFVHTAYDQSGNSRHAVQITAESQPQIVKDGALVLQNSLASVKFNSADSTSLDIDGLASETSAAESIFAVVQLNKVSTETLCSDGIGYEIFSNVSAEGQFAVGGYVNGTQALRNTNAFSEDFGIGSWFRDNASTRLAAYANGTLAQESNSYLALETKVMSILGSLGTTKYFNGHLSAIIFYHSDQESNRVGIEAKLAEL